MYELEITLYSHQHKKGFEEVIGRFDSKEAAKLVVIEIQAKKEAFYKKHRNLYKIIEKNAGITSTFEASEEEDIIIKELLKARSMGLTIKKVEFNNTYNLPYIDFTL